MKDGKIIEVQDSDSLFDRPQQEFTRELISLVPSVGKIIPYKGKE